MRRQRVVAKPNIMPLSYLRHIEIDNLLNRGRAYPPIKENPISVERYRVHWAQAR